jgi:uncharacterized protein (TIGR02391 family)
MAGKPRRPAAEVAEEKVFTSLAEVEQGLTKLKRRLEEVGALDPRAMEYDDPRVSSAAHNISDTVLSVYGPNSPEYRRFRHYQIWHGSIGFGMSQSEIRQRFADGILHAREAIENLIRGLEEKRSDFGTDASTRVRSAFEGLDLHPRIAAVAADLYRGGHYRNAVLDASLALVNLVRERSRRRDLDGAALMTTVFSKNKPLLAFNGLKDRTDEDEQEGMMHLFVGAVLALRNPRAHALLDDSPEIALEYVAFISLLAKRGEQAKLTP